MSKSVADFNLAYSICLPTFGFGTRCHYRTITIRGKENIPEGEHYIIAPCHQNALMDPMLILQMTRKPTAFLARADIFQKPVANFFLTWLRIMPVYRIRDGRDQLSRNEEIFHKSQEVLLRGMPLCLMAEGRHNDKHQLLPLVKGMFRIAGETQRQLGDTPLYILPVGIDYDDYEQVVSSACLSIGKPIDMRPFMADYVENEPVALNHMREALTTALKAQMHHVESKDHYDDEYAYCHLKTQQVLDDENLYNSAWDRFQARKLISDRLREKSDEEREQCLAEGAAFAEQCRQHGIPLWFASKDWGKGKSIVTLLAFAVGLVAFKSYFLQWLICNPIVYLPTHLVPKKIIKDPQFRSSVNYGIRLILTLLYLIIFFIVTCFTGGLGRAIAMLAIGMLSAHATPKLFALLRDAWYGLKQVSKG